MVKASSHLMFRHINNSTASKCLTLQAKPCPSIHLIDMGRERRLVVLSAYPFACDMVT